MADKKKPQSKKVTDIKKKPKKGVDAIVKGGRMGPGTQTEDDVYVGRR
jgi:hypothetical protein